MKANKTEQKALLTLLSRIYHEIRDVEQEWGIHFDEHDFRPRIEYFHDAVRAFSEAGGHGSDTKGRLSVEMLAYDIGMLRYIQANPIPKTRGKIGKLSPQTQVVSSLPRVSGDKIGVKPDANVRYQLTDLYKNYSVIFAAMLTEAADRNYMTRMSEHDTEVEDLAEFMHGIESSAKQRPHGNIDLESLAEDIHNPDLLNRILAGFKSGSLKKKMQAAEALRALKETAQAIDKSAKTLEQAHFSYATGQLAIYEGSRDAIKKMATKGFNIVGDFVQNAINEATRGQRDR